MRRRPERVVANIPEYLTVKELESGPVEAVVEDLSHLGMAMGTEYTTVLDKKRFPTLHEALVWCRAHHNEKHTGNRPFAWLGTFYTTYQYGGTTYASADLGSIGYTVYRIKEGA